MTENALHVELDAPLPSELAVGAGTAVFVAGTCFSPRAPMRALYLTVDGEAQPVLAHSMPRHDFVRSLHPGIDPFVVDEDPRSAEDPRVLAYRSGFWALARIARPGAELALRAELEDGATVSAPLGRLAPPAPEPPAPAPVSEGGPGPLVAICMAAYNPPEDLLHRQLDSIRTQTHRNWVCVISDDGSSPDRLAALEAAVAGDERFVVSPAPRRLGFYRNFERALALAPADAELVAMADQDDRWDPDKLEALIASLGSAQLVYSDARIVTRDGSLVADTYWQVRRNNHHDLLSVLCANSVTGAASLFRRELLDDALPFPPAQFSHFHDHWVALVALALGDIAFVERPLYDYTQHGSASLGHAVANRVVTLGSRLRNVKPLRERARLWRRHYFADVCRLAQFATVLDMRVGDRMSRAKRRSLRTILRGERSPVAFATLIARGTRELVARRPETLGAEWMLSYAFAWRRLIALNARRTGRARLTLDATPPPSLNLQPDRRGAAMESDAVRSVGAKLALLELAPDTDAPPRVNVLVPAVDLDHFFGGYIAMFNLARRLAERGRRVRIVTVDPQPPLPRDWRHRVEAFSGLTGVFDRIEVAFGRESAGLEVSPTDRFVASTWWTAHIAHGAVAQLGRPRFLYLIQEHEPFTFPMGTYAALADASYRLPHVALYSTELLRDYFRARGIGVASDEESVSFQNAITAIDPPVASELAARRPRRLLFYARPEPHAARNLFELGVLALDHALAEGTFLSGWELRGIGTVEGERRVTLGGGVTLDLLPRASQDQYARVLRDHDLGLALMYTPHPSLVPIEMASAGMLTVTNTFENKTADALAAISPNLIAVEPTVEAVAGALREAAGAIDDAERRVRGSAVRWSRDWEESFGEQVMSRVEALLERC